MGKMFPTDSQKLKLLDRAEDGSVVMLNLMKFKETSDDGNGSGWDAYVRYSNETSPLIKAVGGKIIWTGKIEQYSLGAMFCNWDMAALVEYPNRQAFVSMMESPEYEKASIHRINGLEDHIIMAADEMFRRKT
ncbi:MAG: hypothetical protein ACI92E_002956 [Oceanicoccus sp.]|jgi:uncharacterized protein (DUF1330 family)